MISMGVNNKIKPLHNDILELRSDLDAKLKDINDQEDMYDYKRRLDRTTQIGLITTVLATTMLFYLFKQI